MEPDVNRLWHALETTRHVNDVNCHYNLDLLPKDSAADTDV
jgi:hypothetical protein